MTTIMTKIITATMTTIPHICNFLTPAAQTLTPKKDSISYMRHGGGADSYWFFAFVFSSVCQCLQIIWAGAVGWFLYKNSYIRLFALSLLPTPMFSLHSPETSYSWQQIPAIVNSLQVLYQNLDPSWVIWCEGGDSYVSVGFWDWVQIEDEKTYNQ